MLVETLVIMETIRVDGFINALEVVGLATREVRMQAETSTAVLGNGNKSIMDTSIAITGDVDGWISNDDKMCYESFGSGNSGQWW